MKVFITGGAGFIGANLADHHLRRGDEVHLFDNFARPGTLNNLAWLRGRHRERFRLVPGDIRDFEALRAHLPPDTDRVYHLAAQVAVTASVRNPREDFEINARGTFNVLEAVRLGAPDAIVLYASTNKVYGAMKSVAVVEDETRYRYADQRPGISEDEPIDFHSPYGCSKGSGDQYVRDYARIYGLRTVVMRQSCIYGERQLGVEDQGWLAHFCISARFGRPITIYGNGKQVRDVLWIDDLVEAYDMAADAIDVAAGQAYNIGGGPHNTLSVWAEFGRMLADLAGHPISAGLMGWRPGDQPIYVSDIRRAERDLGWRPAVSMREGTERMWRWVVDSPDLRRLTSPDAVVTTA
jgi:CDP-paratose 2-epimerase